MQNIVKSDFRYKLNANLVNILNTSINLIANDKVFIDYCRIKNERGKKPLAFYKILSLFDMEYFEKNVNKIEKDIERYYTSDHVIDYSKSDVIDESISFYLSEISKMKDCRKNKPKAFTFFVSSIFNKLMKHKGSLKNDFIPVLPSVIHQTVIYNLLEDIEESKREGQQRLFKEIEKDLKSLESDSSLTMTDADIKNDLDSFCENNIDSGNNNKPEIKSNDLELLNKKIEDLIEKRLFDKFEHLDRMVTGTLSSVNDNFRLMTITLESIFKEEYPKNKKENKSVSALADEKQLNLDIVEQKKETPIKVETYTVQEIQAFLRAKSFLDKNYTIDNACKNASSLHNVPKSKINKGVRIIKGVNELLKERSENYLLEKGII